MDISVSSLKAFQLPESTSTSTKEPSQKASTKTSDSKGFVEETSDKANANLEKIKEEIKKLATLPSVEVIVSKYGITNAQAQQVLSEACMEIATASGGTPEQVTKNATNLYLLAELTDSEIYENFDIEKMMSDAMELQALEDEKNSDAKKVAEKYNIPLNVALAVVDKTEQEKPSTVIISDLLAKPTYTINNCSNTISFNNNSFPLSTFSFGA